MSQPETILKTGDALLLVDVQNCFCPGGELPIEGGDEVVPVLNAWIRVAERLGLHVYLSRDFHPGRHPSFATHGGDWPQHCIEGTPGADFHPDLIIPETSTTVTKGTRFDMDQHSAFDETGLEIQMHRDTIQRVFIGGLALDVCVRSTVLDALRLGFITHVIVDGCRPVTAQGGQNALDEMRTAGAILEE